jgi:hypothetical protein
MARAFGQPSSPVFEPKSSGIGLSYVSQGKQLRVEHIYIDRCAAME